MSGFSAEPIPLTVIGGYLGAGKTTLLNQLLRASIGRRLAVIVNDFGSVNVDATLVSRHDGETLSLTNGCICCTMANGFQTALATLLDRPAPPEHIVVEASGVSDPLRIGQYGHLPGFRLDGVIVLADAETIRTRSQDRYVGPTIIRQLQGADILILTKTDLVSAVDREAVREWLYAIAPDATVIEARSGDIDPALLLGIGAHDGNGSLSDPLHGAADHEHRHESWTYERATPMTGEDIDAFAAIFPPEIVRAKGLVWFAETPGRSAVFQLVGQRWSLTEGPEWESLPPRTQIVLIASRPGLDWALLRQRFHRELPE